MRLPTIVTGIALVALPLLVAVACGGSDDVEIGTPDAAAESSTTTPPTTPDAGDASTGDASTDDAGCPATYADATGSCEGAAKPAAGDLTCVYPQGTCRCAPPRCGGVVIPIDEDASTSLQWRCTAPRTDGCPERNPDGQSCAEANKRCNYPNGCCTDFATCSEGRWVTRPGACPF